MSDRMVGESQRGSLWRNPAMLLLAVYTATAFTGFFATLAALPAWLVTEGVPRGAAGQVTTVFLIVTVATQVSVPRLVSRFGLGAVLTIGLLALAVPMLGFLASSNVVWVFALSALRGIGFGIATVLGASMTARVVPANRRGEAIGIYGLSIALPNLLALPGGVALVAANQFFFVIVLGLVPLLGLVGVPALARSVAANSIPEPTTAPLPAASVATNSADSSSQQATSRRRARLAAAVPTLVLAAVTLVGGGFLTYLPIERPDGVLATVAVLAWGLSGAFVRWRSGPIADRYGMRLLLPAAVVANVVGIAVVVLGLLLPDDSLASFVIVGGALIFGIGYGGIQNLTLVAAFARARHRETETVSSVWNIGFDVGTALGAASVGALTLMSGVPIAIGLTALLMIAVLPLAIISARPPAAD